MPCRFRYRAALAALLAWPALAPAEPTVTLTPKPGTLANLAPVVAPSARCAAVSDAHGLLAFAHERTYPDAHLTLVRLDAKGTPAAYATSWKLPCPPALAKAGTYPLSLAFHPKLPLLYVWRDVAVNFPNPPGELPPTLKDFDHLLIYDVSKAQPAIVVTLCRGKGYMFGQQGGGLAVDRAGAFLYVPAVMNLKNWGTLKFGRFPLDADGLPDVLGEKERKLPVAERVKRLVALNAAGMQPPQRTPFEYGYILSWNNGGNAHSFAPLSPDAVVAGSPRGLVVWRPNDKDATLNHLPLRKANNTQVVAHPALPLAFACSYNTDLLFRIQLADGYPTLLPEQWVIPDAVLLSPPAVLSKANKVAVGGRYFVYVVSLDDKGHARPEAVQVQVFNPQVRALVYSERFDRLYVSVELSR